MTRTLLSLVVALCLAGAVQAQSKSGPAKFSAPGDSVAVSIGDKLKVDATFKVINVGPMIAVSVQGMMKNTSNKKLNYSYNVAFLDKDKNLVVAHNSTLFMDAGKQGNVGTFVALPPEQLSRIAYYSVALHENEKQIGSK